MLKQEQVNKYNPIKLFLKAYNYDVWFEIEEWSDKTRKSDEKEFAHLSDIHPYKVMKK